jgi:hypothetical protein
MAKVGRVVDVRELLVEELTKANGSAHDSWAMVRRIETETLELPAVHSKRAHELAAELRALRGRAKCGHCGHPRDDHQGPGDQDCVSCSCVKWLAGRS